MHYTLFSVKWLVAENSAVRTHNHACVYYSHKSISKDRSGGLVISQYLTHSNPGAAVPQSFKTWFPDVLRCLFSRF